MPTNSHFVQELFSGPWIMEPIRLQEFVNCSLKMKCDGLEGIEIAARDPKMSITGKTAIISISGVLLKSVPDWMKFWGFDCTGYDDVRRMLAQALADSQVSDIELHITSPGGQVAGGIETAQDILAARDMKPVRAHVEDLCASGAYWLASQAESISAGQNCEVGSIGAYMVYVDWSKFYEDAGVKVHVIRSGPYKGQGVIGAPIDEDFLNVENEIIDQMAGHFIDGVAAGRGMEREKVAELATGRVWLGPEAQRLGLIDAVRMPDQKQQTSKKGESMATETQTKETTEAVKTVDQDAIAKQARDDERQRCADLKAAFKDDAAFALEAIEEGWTVEQAKGIAYDRAQAEKNNRKPRGAEPLEQEGEGGRDSQESFMPLARSRSQERKVTMTEAMRQIQGENPEAYEAFLEQQESRRLQIKSGGGRRVTR